MAGVFERSWEITKLSFGVIRRDPELLLFPLFGGVASVLYAVAISVPAFMLMPRGHDNPSEDPTFRAALYATAFAVYFGLAFVATFFNTCAVYTTKVRLEGGDASLGDSLAYATSRIGHIAGWSAIAASVGVLLRFAERLAERSGGIGGMILDLVSGMLGLLWSVVTIFVVPQMVYRGQGPIDAIRGSAEVIKRTWGESLVRHFGLGLLQFLCVFAGLVVGAALIYLVRGHMVAVLAVIGVFGLYTLAVVLTFNVANTVFNTALFVYATTGDASGGFDSAHLQDAFRHR